MPLDAYFMITVLTFIISIWGFIIYKVLTGKLKWNSEVQTFSKINTFDDDHDHRQRICDAVNISHGHPPGVPYIR